MKFVLQFAGLFLTYLGLYLMDGNGQPALLYLVPCTLGTYQTTDTLVVHTRTHTHIPSRLVFMSDYLSL